MILDNTILLTFPLIISVRTSRCDTVVPFQAMDLGNLVTHWLSVSILSSGLFHIKATKLAKLSY